MTTSNLPEASPLGKPAAYQTEYTPSLLFPIPRQPKRDEIGVSGVSGTLPFFGVDIWNAYELSWLNLRGKPQVAIATFTVPADSPNIIESKSFKLYLNSFNQTKLAGPDALAELLRADLSAGFGSPVQVKLTMPESFDSLQMGELEGLLLDRLDIEVNSYKPDASLVGPWPRRGCAACGDSDGGRAHHRRCGAGAEPVSGVRASGRRVRHRLRRGTRAERRHPGRSRLQFFPDRAPLHPSGRRPVKPAVARAAARGGGRRKRGRRAGAPADARGG